MHSSDEDEEVGWWVGWRRREGEGERGREREEREGREGRPMS